MINWITFNELHDLMGDSGIAGLLTTYTDTTPAQLATMNDAAKTGDCETLLEQAHSLKSASGFLGLTELHQGLEILCNACRENTLDNDAVNQVQQIHTLYEQGIIALRNKILAGQ